MLIIMLQRLQIRYSKPGPDLTPFGTGTSPGLAQMRSILESLLGQQPTLVFS